MKKYFIIYEVIKNERGEIVDIINTYDNDKLKDVAEWLSIDYSNINKYIIDNLDDINKIRHKQIKNNNYFIFKDYE